MLTEKELFIGLFFVAWAFGAFAVLVAVAQEKWRK